MQQFKDWNEVLSVFGAANDTGLATDYEFVIPGRDISLGYKDGSGKWRDVATYAPTAEGLAKLNAELPGLIAQRQAEQTQTEKAEP